MGSNVFGSHKSRKRDTLNKWSVMKCSVMKMSILESLLIWRSRKRWPWRYDFYELKMSSCRQEEGDDKQLFRYRYIQDPWGGMDLNTLENWKETCWAGDSLGQGQKRTRKLPWEEYPRRESASLPWASLILSHGWQALNFLKPQFFHL